MNIEKIKEELNLRYIYNSKTEINVSRNFNKLYDICWLIVGNSIFEKLRNLQNSLFFLRGIRDDYNLFKKYIDK